MWRYHPDLLQTPVPRYTSYPTAASFGSGIGSAAMREALERLPAGEPVSLYIHIPWCKAICWYCGCNTNRAGNAARVAAYVEALVAEIDTVARLIAGRASIRQIAFGGGSPNALEPLAFIRLVDHILTRFNAAAPNISVELDPRSLSPAWARIIGKVGATRASLGVQTFDPEIQARIGRVQPVGLIEDAVAMLRRNGITSLNFDLMYGLPGQTPAILADTLTRAIAMRPERIALFGYAHVPQSIPRQRRIRADDLPDLETRFRMAAASFEQLVAAGYCAIGFDHFALPGEAIARAAEAGQLRRNFQGFTEDGCETLIGLGSTAVSLLPDLIVQNEKNAGRYRARAHAGELAATLGVRRTPSDRSHARVIENILCGRAADLSALEENSACERRLKPFLDLGLAEVRAHTLTLGEGALPYARAIAACFDCHRPARSAFSTAV